MESKNQFQFEKNLQKRTINVTRSFDASIDEVWNAWTNSKVLDKWWAPKPWRAQTKSMDFRAGGHWLYAMVGPENEMQWSKADFISIEPKKGFDSADYFCDENGTRNESMPSMNWSRRFRSSGEGTTIDIVISFDKESDLQKIINMGFKEGFAAGLSNLDEVLATSKV